MRASASVFIGLLFTTLTYLLTPSGVHAQSPTPPPPSRGGNLYQAVPQGCKATTELPLSGTAEPFCPSGAVGDTVPYIAPCADQTAESTSCKIDASAFTDSVSWVNQVKNSVYGMTGADGNQYVIQQSNNKHLTYRIDASVISLMEDTTWSNSVTCNENGQPAISRLFTGGSPGGGFMGRSYSCGATQSFNAELKAFQYDPILDTTPMAPVPECTSQYEGQLGGTNQLIYHGPATCADWDGDAMVIQNVGGAGVGEVFVFCEGRGLCAWYQNIDFTKTQPREWVGKDLCTGLGQVGRFGDNIMCTQAEIRTDRIDLPKELKQQVGIGTIVNNLGFNVDIGGELWPARDSSFDPGESPTIDKPEGRLSRYAQAVQAFGFNFLNPQRQQIRTTHDITPQKLQETSRLCGDVAGNQINVISEVTTIQSGEERKINLFKEGSRRASAMFARRIQPDQNYNTDPSLELDPSSALECGPGDPSERLTEQKNGADDRNLYSSVQGNDLIGNTVTSIVVSAADLVVSILDLLGVKEYVLPINLYAHGSTLCPWCAYMQCLYGGCEEEEITNAPYIANRAELVEEGGIVETFQPQVMAVENVHGDQDQEYCSTITGECTTSDIKFHSLKGLQNSGDFWSCSMMPGALQDDLVGDGVCDQTWVDESRLLGRNTIPPDIDPAAGSSVVSYGDNLHNNTACTIAPETIVAAAARLNGESFTYQGQTYRYYTQASYGPTTKQTLQSQWQSVQDQALAQGVSPLFALTLWLEETAAGSIGGVAMGCAPGSLPTGNSPQATQAQIRCLAGVVNEEPNFNTFMCRYSGERQPDGSYNCSTFTNNPNFPKNIWRWYDFLSFFTPGLPQSCQLTGSAPPGVQSMR